MMYELSRLWSFLLVAFRFGFTAGKNSNKNTIMAIMSFLWPKILQRKGEKKIGYKHAVFMQRHRFALE